MKSKKPQAKSKKLVFTYEAVGDKYSGGTLTHGKVSDDLIGRYICSQWRAFLKLPMRGGTYRLTVTIKRVKGGSR